MQQKKINHTFFKMCMLVTIGFIALSFTTKFGLDSFEIYLNDKVVLKQYINQPLSLRTLQLSEVNKNDQLRIVYRHCTNKGSGTDRIIVLKNEKGQELKKWDFKDANGSDVSMTIAVKELLSLESANSQHQLSLYYSARELQKSEMLSALNF
ncbi:MAG: hypothetical protein QM802_23235 [Agriterribacter sp.]